MADKKISECEFATVINLTDIIPVVQLQANKKITFGQLKSFNSAPNVISVTSNTITSVSDAIFKITGNCILPVATIDGTVITIVSSGAGKLISVSLLPSDGFTFNASGATAKLIYTNSVWNVLSTNNMIVGIA